LSRSGPTRAERAEVAVDQIRLLGAQLVRAEPVALGDADAQILQHHVGALEDQRAQARRLAGVAEIDRDAALVAVERLVGRGGAVPPRRAPAARVVALLGVLDLDHVGAEIGQDHARVGRRDTVSELDDRHARERRCADHSRLLHHREKTLTVTPKRVKRAAHAAWT